MQELEISQPVREGVTKILQDIYFMQSLADDDIELVRSNLILRCYDKNETIIQEGQQGNYFYIIWMGEVRVVRGKGFFRSGTELARLGAGDFFGESALVSDAPRNASVLSVASSKLLLLKRSPFDLLRQRNPEFETAMNDLAQARKAKK